MYLDPKRVLRDRDLHGHGYVLDLESSEYDVIHKISCNYTQDMFFQVFLIFRASYLMNDKGNLNTYIEQMKSNLLLDQYLQ